jgi:hypothetical protein
MTYRAGHTVPLLATDSNGQEIEIDGRVHG